jgi:hypothetical protein
MRGLWIWACENRLEEMKLATIGCKEPGCPNPHHAQKLCQPHYRNAMRAGDIGIEQPKPPVPVIGAGICQLCDSAFDTARRSGKRFCSSACRTRASGIKLDFDMSIDEYKSLIKKQDGMCAICSFEPDRVSALHVDHNHTTGAHRGLLCRACNTGIGLLGEDIQRLESAKQYLIKHSGTPAKDPLAVMWETL